MLSVHKYASFHTGTRLIEQGEQANYFYVLASGQCDAVVRAGPKPPAELSAVEAAQQVCACMCVTQDA